MYPRISFSWLYHQVGLELNILMSQPQYWDCRCELPCLALFLDHHTVEVCCIRSYRTPHALSLASGIFFFFFASGWGSSSLAVPLFWDLLQFQGLSLRVCSFCFHFVLFCFASSPETSLVLSFGKGWFWITAKAPGMGVVIASALVSGPL